jgi:hypothetical protein
VKEIEERKDDLPEALWRVSMLTRRVTLLKHQSSPPKHQSPAHTEYLHSLFDRWGAVRLADILDKLEATSAFARCLRAAAH